MSTDQPDDLEPPAPTRPRGHTLQDRLRRSAEQRVQHQARAREPGQGGPGAQDELQALLDLLNNGPSVPPITPPVPPSAAPPQAPPSAAPAAPAAPSTFQSPPEAPPAPPTSPLTPDVVPPAAEQHPHGTFTRETFTRETFVPGTRPDAPFVPSSDPRWEDEGEEATWPQVPQARVLPAPGVAVPAPVPLPPVPDPDEVEIELEPDEWEDEHDLVDDELDERDNLPAVRGVPAVHTHKAPGVVGRRRMRRDLRQAKRETRMAKRRYRILPRTVIGITAMLLVAAMAAGASGAVLYAYYDWRLTQNEDRVGDLAEGLETRLTDADTAVENATNEAVADVRAEGDALRELINDQNRIAELLPLISESVWYVSTLDDSGRASVGSAFVVSGDDDGSLLLASYATVAAATVDPAPEITLRKGDRTMVASLYAWDPARDLALLTVSEPNMGALVWANEEQRAEAAGKRGYVATGLGGAEATISPGQVLDLTANEIQHNVAISEQYQGGPLLTSDGTVLGVASMEYEPLNFESTGGVSFAVPVGLACEQVLTCNGDSPA
jgi:S1-C subfamily serine protease